MNRFNADEQIDTGGHETVYGLLPTDYKSSINTVYIPPVIPQRESMQKQAQNIEPIDMPGPSEQSFPAQKLFGIEGLGDANTTTGISLLAVGAAIFVGLYLYSKGYI